MFRSLRNRLILSHILPALLVIPLMGAAMVYVLETRLLLPVIYNDLSADARLMAEITRGQPVFWESSAAAQALVDGVTPYLSGRVALVTLDGRLLASSDQTNDSQVELPDLSDVEQGGIVELQNGSLAEAFTPVFDLAGRPIGIVRMTTRVVTVSDEVYQLRYLLGGILLLGVLAGVGLGSYLALSINRPIQRVANSIQALAEGDWQAHVEERGPDEMRALAARVNTLVDQLNSLEKSRRQLLANLVHELGRPLGAIRSAIQAMQKGAGKDPQLEKDLLNGLDTETVRLQHLLDELAELHEQILGRLELKEESVEISGWLAGVLSPWEAAAHEKGLVWKKDIVAPLPDIFMDADRMAQAVGNLLSNAVKFTPHGGEVEIVVKKQDERFIVEVMDTGPGIPMEERERIFQPFYRGSHGRRIVQGMGLGLSIARDIAIAHGGGIELQEKAGAGSRFVLWIPVMVQPEA
jgi:signal transduction histidine kinase